MLNYSKLISLIAASIIASTTLAQSKPWNEKYYNPHPADDDLILPIPCEGAMVFRRVETENKEGAIGDAAVILGQEGDAQPFLNGLRRSYVSGPFSDSQDNKSNTYFYMAKYELAKAQYDFVMAEDCTKLKTPRRLEFLPAVGFSKLEYEAFAEKYSLWLMQLKKDDLPDDDERFSLLPKTGDKIAYLRLPTEEEWEYAARGGLAVSKTEFRLEYPPIKDGDALAEYIANGDSNSAGGKVQVIGKQKPNPLGLHDMLGNVSELVGTSFSLVRHGRLHGKTGGIVKRGGDARTPLGSISSATRDELNPFDTSQMLPTRNRYMATRLVIGGLSLFSQQEGKDLAKALDDIAKLDSALANVQTEEEVIRIIDALKQDVVSPKAKSQLALIRDTVQRGRAERNTQRNKSIRLILESGTLICNQAVQRYLNAIAIRAILPSYLEFEAEARETGDANLLAEVEEALYEARDSLAKLDALAKSEIVEYANIIEGLASDYSLDLLKKQASFIKSDVEARGSRRGSCLMVMRTHLAVRSTAGFSDVEVIGLDFDSIAQTEADK